MDVSAHHPDLVIFLVEVVQKDIAQGDHAHELALMAYGEMPEAVAPHQRHAAFEIFVRADGQWIVRHDLSHAGAARITPFSDHPAHQISLREDADEIAIVDDGNGADVALDHGANSLKNGVAEVRLIGLLIFDQVADTHLIPPGYRIRAGPKHLPGREYMPNSRCREE